MKTALLISVLVLGGHFFSPTFISKEKTSLSSYATTRHKKSTALPVGPLRVVVDKSSYELSVYDSKGWYATYPVVFGNPSLGDKKMEGDRNTPEGTFQIVSKRVHEKWCRYMALNYPTSYDMQKFQERKRRGEIPPNASPGGGIGIHGVWPHEDFVIDRYKNWTNGCISLKNDDVKELYSYLTVGTTITIRK